jgi:hypothetical protein
LATVAHRHAVGLVRAEAEAMNVGGAAPDCPRRGCAPDPDSDVVSGEYPRGCPPRVLPEATKSRELRMGTRGSTGVSPVVSWICERELREGQGGRPLHLPDGVVVSTDDRGRRWRTAVEVELTRKTEVRVAGILRHLLSAYDDVVYHAVEDAGRVVSRAADAAGVGARVHVRPFPPAVFAAIG